MVRNASRHAQPAEFPSSGTLELVANSPTPAPTHEGESFSAEYYFLIFHVRVRVVVPLRREGAG